MGIKNFLGQHRCNVMTCNHKLTFLFSEKKMTHYAVLLFKLYSLVENKEISISDSLGSVLPPLVLSVSTILGHKVILSVQFFFFFSEKVS